MASNVFNVPQRFERGDRIEQECKRFEEYRGPLNWAQLCYNFDESKSWL